MPANWTRGTLCFVIARSIRNRTLIKGVCASRCRFAPRAPVEMIRIVLPIGTTESARNDADDPAFL